MRRTTVGDTPAVTPAFVRAWVTACLRRCAERYAAAVYDQHAVLSDAELHRRGLSRDIIQRYFIAWGGPQAL